MNFPKKFVCATREYASPEHHVSAPLFRRSFMLASLPDKAELIITGLGFYELFVNGERVTKGYLAPYISNPDDIIYYDRYDLAKYLNKGENVIGIILGNGMNNAMTHTWEFSEAVFRSSPKMALSFSAECGAEKIEFDASDFVCSESAITFDCLRFGVHYDARLYKDGWCKAGFDDSDWREPILAERPRGKARFCEAEPIVVTEERLPVSVEKGELAPYVMSPYEKPYPFAIETEVEREGGYIYDFGKNGSGIFRFKIKNAKAGQRITFQCCEYIDRDGKASYANICFFPDGYIQRDVYICRGGDEEIFVPLFTYHGCRYIYVHGIDEKDAVPETLTFLVMNSDIKKRAYFNCSDEMTNKIWEAAQNSDISNFHYFPTDCPHREKNGWTGDAAMSAEHMIFTLTVENSLKEWLRNIRAAQNDEGALPGIVPTTGWGFEWGNGPGWDSVIFTLPYMMYIYRGDTDVIKENRHAMMRYLEYAASKRDERGLVSYGLGDWSPIDGKAGDSINAKTCLTNSILLYDMCVKAEKMFKAIGDTLNASYAAGLGREMKAAVRENLIDFDTMTVDGSCQTAQAMAIYYGIFEGAEIPEASRVLVRLVHEVGDSLDGGLYGLRVVLHVLSMCGESELAYHMITKREFPSYAYYIDLGLTTFPEQFRMTVGSCASLDHHMYCDVIHWFMRHILGINVNPKGNDANNILIKPNFISTLDFAEGYYEAPSGKVEVRWERDGENIRLDVKCDEAIKCEIKLPRGYTFGREQCWHNYFEGGNAMLTAYPLKPHFGLEAGSYIFDGTFY